MSKHKNKPITINGMDTMLTGYDVIDGIWGLTTQDTKKLQIFEPFTSDIYETQIIENNQQNYILPKIMTPSWPISSDVSFHHGTSAKSYSNTLSVSIDGSTEYCGFRGSISSSLSQTTQQSSSTTMASMREGTVTVALTCSPTPDLRPYMTKDARDAINGTGASQLTPRELITAYGSHFLTGGVFGGVIETNAHGFTQNISDSQDLKTTISASYDVLTHGSATVQDQTDSTEFNASFTVTHKIHGGNRADGIKAAASFSTDDLAKWTSSVPAEPTLIALNQAAVSPPTAGAATGTLPSNPSPLAPIWNLCDDPTRAAAIKAEFETMIAENPYTDGIDFVGVNQFVRTETPADGIGNSYQQLVQTINPDFLSTANAAGGNWMLDPSDQFKGYYVANSGPTTTTPSSSDVVPVYGFILDTPPGYNEYAKEGYSGIYVYSLQKYAINSALNPHGGRAGQPIAMQGNNPDCITFYAFASQVDITLMPVYQYRLDVEVFDPDGIEPVFRYSMEESLPMYTKSNYAMEGASDHNKQNCIAFYAYPVV